MHNASLCSSPDNVMTSAPPVVHAPHFHNHSLSPHAEKECKVPCIDVHTPSQRLVEQLPADAANMTHDGAHWSRSLNIVFAQEVFRTLLESCE